MATAIKIRDHRDDKALITKDAQKALKSKVIVLNPEESIIAKNLKITEKGVYGVKT